MELRQLHSSQKEAMKKIAEFSGEPNELDIDEWLCDLTNLFSLMKLNNESRILETMGKLTGPALRWYQENLTSFTSWENAETALRNRFKPFISNGQLMQEFFQMQQHNESVTSFYDRVIRKYNKAKKFITEQQALTVLQAGVENSLKEYLIRSEEEINKPEEWLKLARQEEHIQKIIRQRRDNFPAETTSQPFFEQVLPTTTIQPKPSNIRSSKTYTNTPRHMKQRQHQRPNQSESNRRGNHQYVTHTRTNVPDKKIQKEHPCLICNRKNHPTNKCFYKKENGCFKCGQPTHQVRNCPQHRFFE
jgi:hypothetical protein